jgi:hypothetical protein
MSGIGLALSAASAFMQFRQGQAQAAMYKGMAGGLEVQAQFTRFSAKQESLKHRKNAADSLDATLMRLAQINAAAGAGHMDPFSGNPYGLRIRALDVGGTNYAMARLNETITILTGEGQAQMQEYQAARARAAGKTAKQFGMMGAMLTLAGGAFNYFQTSPGMTSTSIQPNPGFPSGTGAGYLTNPYSLYQFPSSGSSMIWSGSQGSKFLQPTGYL